MKRIFSLLLIVMTFFSLTGLCYAVDAPEVHGTVKAHDTEHNAQASVTQGDKDEQSFMFKYGDLLWMSTIVFSWCGVITCMVFIGRNYGMVRLKKKSKEAVRKSSIVLGIILFISIVIEAILMHLMLLFTLPMGLIFGVWAYFDPSIPFLDRYGDWKVK